MKTKNNALFSLFSIFIISFIFFSCGNKTKQKESFPREKNIVFEDMNLKEQLGIALFMKSIGNYLVVTEKNIETQVQLIDKKTKASHLFGQTGEGPGRLLQAYNIMPIDDKRVGIYDVQKRTLFGFNIDSVIQLNSACLPEVLIKEIPSFPMSVDRLSDSVYVSLGLMSELKRFTLLNNQGEVISMEGALPEKKQEQISDFVHAFAYYGKLTTNPKESKIAVCTNYAGIIQFYDCKTKEVRLIKEYNSFLADYTERDGNFAPTPQTRWGYLSMDSNDKYVFALYSGMNQVQNSDGAFLYSNTIHVYDWEGNKICKLLLNDQIKIICVDDTHLYGYSSEFESILVAEIKDI
jgi:hypothetical protein